MLRLQTLAKRGILSPLAATLVLFALGSGGVTAQPITEIIDLYLPDPFGLIYLLCA